MILDKGNVDARDHDLAGDGVAKVEDLVDHLLFLVGKIVGVGNHVADLFLGDILAIVGRLDVEKAGQSVGGSRGQPHQGLGNLGEGRNEPNNTLGALFGIGQGDALRKQLAHHNREVGNDQRNDDGRDYTCWLCWHAKRDKPGSQGVGKRGCGNRRGAKTDKRDAYLDCSQKLAGVPRKFEGCLRALISFAGLRLENSALRGGKSHL